VKAAILWVILWAGVAAAAPTTEHPLDDTAGVIAAPDEPAIEDALRQLRAEHVDVAVIVVQSLGGTSIESYARSAAKSWATGRSDAAVLVLAIRDRKSRIEVSDSLRARFPDQRAQAILDNSRGYLRTGDYAGAVKAIVGEVRAAAGGVAPDLESPHPPSPGPSTATPEPVRPPPDPGYAYRSHQTNYVGWLIILIAIGVVLLIGALWAGSTRGSTGTLTAAGMTHPRAFVLDWGWHALKVIGWVIYIVFVIASSGRSSSSSSSSWSSSSRSSSSSSSSGGGWSGGGASSSW
jgi:uncharacterized protein